MNRLADVVETTRLLGFLCDTDIIDVTAQVAPLRVSGLHVSVIQVHVLAAGAKGAARLARTTRLTADPMNHTSVVKWCTWVGWVDLGPEDTLLSMRVTTTQTTLEGTQSPETTAGGERPGECR